MKTSVIIATFNGELYIKKQLESILNQTIIPNEVIIRDDCSSDNTVRIIQTFISENKLINWGVYINDVNKGWKKNFYELMEEASGDVIFYCDQDDIWDEHRIERVINKFSENINAKCIMCSYDSIDGDDNILSYGKNDGDFSPIKSESRKYYKPLGCLMAYRKELNNYIFSVVNEEDRVYFSPDQVLARISAFFNGFYELNNTLVKHRFHDRNVTNRVDIAKNLSGSSDVNERIKLLIEQNAIMEKIMKIQNIDKEKMGVDDVNNVYVFTQDRISFLSNLNFKNFFALIKHIRMHNKIEIIADVMYAMKVQKIAGKIFVMLKGD